MSEKPSFYRDAEVRKKIENKAKKTFDTSDGSIDIFFMLGDEKLTDQERRDFELFTEYVGKRIVNATLRKPDSGVEDVESAKYRLRYSRNGLGIIPSHDPAHAIVAYERSKDNSVISQFLQVDQREAWVNPEIVVEEFPAFLWTRAFEGVNLFTSLMSKECAEKMFNTLRIRARKSVNPERFVRLADELEAQLDPQDFESVRKTFERYIVGILKSSNPKHISAKLVREAEPMLDAAVELSQANPDEKYLAFAKRIFNEYPANKRLFIEEFERIMAPLLERLRRKDAAAK